jgi:hypothetical protein
MPETSSPDELVTGSEAQVSGYVYVCFAVDTGASIDVERARYAVHGLVVEAPRNDPDRVILYCSRPVEPVDLFRGHRLEPMVRYTMYADFGAISLRFRMPFTGTMQEWVAVSSTLCDNEALQSLALRCAADISKELGTAVQELALAKEAEDYLIYCLEVRNTEGIEGFIERNRTSIAQVVNAESLALHSEVIKETMESRVSWYRHDCIFIEWTGAALVRSAGAVEEELTDDTVTALEFANMQLHQFNILSQKLDRAIIRAYQVTTDLEVSEQEQQFLDGLTIDAAELLGRVTSGLKVFSNRHQARLLRVVARRFEFPGRSDEIRVKLSDLRTIRQRVVDAKRHKQSHLIEILIAGLFMVEVIPLVYRGILLAFGLD